MYGVLFPPRSGAGHPLQRVASPGNRRLHLFQGSRAMEQMARLRDAFGETVYLLVARDDRFALAGALSIGGARQQIIDRRKELGQAVAEAARLASGTGTGSTGRTRR